jgi:mercuric ion transport protein
MAGFEDTSNDEGRAATGALAAGGLIAALLASSCCILPLVLVSIGAGGAWLARLTALAPYQRSPSTHRLRFVARLCQTASLRPGTLCERPSTGRIATLILWAGFLLTIAAAGIDLLGRIPA